MAELWNRYESLILFDPDLGEEARTELIGRVKEYITNASGRILKTDHWGLRDLAFVMKGRSKAYYLLVEFAGPAPVSTELARRLNLLDTVLKFQTIKLEDRVDPAELPEAEEESGVPAAEEKGAEEALAAEAAAAQAGDAGEAEKTEE